MPPPANFRRLPAGAPNDLAAAPNDLVAAPNDLAAAPNDLAATPNDLAATPKGLAAAPKGLAATPKGLAALAPVLPWDAWLLIARRFAPADRARLRLVCAEWARALSECHCWRDLPAHARLRALFRACGLPVPAVRWVLRALFRDAADAAAANSFHVRYNALSAACACGNAPVVEWLSLSRPLRGLLPRAAAKLLHRAGQCQDASVFSRVWDSLGSWTVWRDDGRPAPRASSRPWAPFGAFSPAFHRYAPLGDPLQVASSAPPARLPRASRVPRRRGPDLLARKLLASGNLQSLAEVFLTVCASGHPPTIRCAIERFGSYLEARAVLLSFCHALSVGAEPVYTLLAEAFLPCEWRLDTSAALQLVSAGFLGGPSCADWAVSVVGPVSWADASPPDRETLRRAVWGAFAASAAAEAPDAGAPRFSDLCRFAARFRLPATHDLIAAALLAAGQN